MDETFIRDFFRMPPRKSGAEVRACNCVGPQNGQPLCPCMMAGVTVVDGRYVKVIDYGPAPVGSDKKAPTHD